MATTKPENKFYRRNLVFRLTLRRHIRVKKTKIRGLSPQANYTYRETAAVGEVVPTFADTRRSDLKYISLRLLV
jgi:hypothetical protein